jgi:peptidoglycan hydrolase CwlO-like protein
VRKETTGEMEMNKKILSAIFAAVVLFSMTATAMAAPDETAAPTDTTAPTATAPADTGNAFIEQVKAMRDKVRALQAQLADERKYDRQVRSEIREIQGIVATDKTKVAEYRKELKAIDDKIKKLNQDLKTERKSKDKDTAKIAQLQADIQAAKDERAALVAKYQPLIDQIKGNAAGRRSLKPLREQLRAKYAELKPLFEASKALTKSINSQIIDLKNAIKAGDETKAVELVSQINAKLIQQEDNINQRITIRKSMRQILDDYKAKLQAV